MSGFAVATRPGALWVEQRGQGTDLVLLSGLGDTHEAWSCQLESLAHRHRLTAIDNRGSGRSELPPGDFSLADMAGDAAAVMDELGIEQAHVAGFSMGGAIAQELALARPELVSSLILVGTWCRTDEHQHRIFESWGWMAEHAPSDIAFVRALYLWVYTRRAHRDGSIENWIRDALAAEPPQSADAFVRTVRAMLGHDTADRLESIEAPVLVIAGEEDLLFPPEVQRDLVGRFTSARLELLPGEAHQPFQEAPDTFDPLVLQFLSSV